MTKLQPHLLTGATTIGNLGAEWIRSTAKPSGVAGGAMSNRVQRKRRRFLQKAQSWLIEPAVWKNDGEVTGRDAEP